MNGTSRITRIFTAASGEVPGCENQAATVFAMACSRGDKFFSTVSALSAPVPERTTSPTNGMTSNSSGSTRPLKNPNSTPKDRRNRYGLARFSNR